MAESRLEQKDQILKQKDQTEQELMETNEQMHAELQEQNAEIDRLTEQMAQQEHAAQLEKMAMKEMHTLIVRLQDKAA